MNPNQVSNQSFYQYFSKYWPVTSEDQVLPVIRDAFLFQSQTKAGIARIEQALDVIHDLFPPGHLLMKAAQRIEDGKVEDSGDRDGVKFTLDDSFVAP